MSRSAWDAFLASSCSAELSWSIMSSTSPSNVLVSWNAFSASSLVLVDAYEKKPESAWRRGSRGRREGSCSEQPLLVEPSERC